MQQQTEAENEERQALCGELTHFSLSHFNKEASCVTHFWCWGPLKCYTDEKQNVRESTTRKEEGRENSRKMEGEKIQTSELRFLKTKKATQNEKFRNFTQIKHLSKFN